MQNLYISKLSVANFSPMCYQIIPCLTLGFRNTNWYKIGKTKVFFFNKLKWGYLDISFSQEVCCNLKKVENHRFKYIESILNILITPGPITHVEFYKHATPKGIVVVNALMLLLLK